MKKVVINIFIICLYCFPFVYFSMYQDFENQSMIGYVIMIIATSTLAFFCKLTKNRFALITGNIASTMISYYFIDQMSSNERWGGYFKPLAPVQLLVLVSFLNLIPQFFVSKCAHKNKYP